MIKWAKVCDEETGACIVGLGEDEEYYRSEGFSELDVELGYRGGWYLAGRAPVQPLEELKAETCSYLWTVFKEWQTERVDAEDLVLASMGSLAGLPKCAAVRNWVMDLWGEYYRRKDMIAAAGTAEEVRAVDLSASSCGEPPYTIRELNEEVKNSGAAAE